MPLLSSSCCAHEGALPEAVHNEDAIGARCRPVITMAGFPSTQLQIASCTRRYRPRPNLSMIEIRQPTALLSTCTRRQCVGSIAVGKAPHKPPIQGTWQPMVPSWRPSNMQDCSNTHGRLQTHTHTQPYDCTHTHMMPHWTPTYARVCHNVTSPSPGCMSATR